MQQTQQCFYGFIISNIGGKCFLCFYLKQVKYFLADKNTCVILCEFLNKVYIYIKKELFVLLLLFLSAHSRLNSSTMLTRCSAGCNV